MTRYVLTASSLFVLSNLTFAAPAASSAQPAATVQPATTAPVAAGAHPASAVKPATAAQTANLAAWENSVRAREQRATLLRDEIKALDARIESRIDSLITALRSIADSKDSRTKVARMKRETIDRLQKVIDYYKNKRAVIQEELRRPTLNLTPAQKQQVVTKFDARIAKRVSEILALQQSMPGEKDYDRYKTTGSGWWGNTYELNEDYTQNQKLSSHTNLQREEIVKGLRASIERLEQQNRILRANGAPIEEMTKTDALIAERRKLLVEAQTPVAVPTRTVGGKEAADLDKSLKTAITDLQRDFNTLFTRYNAGLQEMASLNAARAQLAAIKAKQ